MSEVNILFDGILHPEATDSQPQLLEPDFFSKIVDEIVETALVIAEDHNAIVQSVLSDIIRDVSCRKQKFQYSISSSSSSSSSSESEISSESSYRVPSYLAERRSELEFSQEIVVEVEQEHTCEQYEDIDKYAGVVVDKIINKAIAVASIHIAEGEIVQGTGGFKLEGEEEGGEEEEEEESDTTTSSVVEWPTIEAFTIEYGLTKIYEFMDTWDYEEDWLYCVDFLTAQSDDCSDYYKYEALWSIPTQMYPVPQATASIYFTIERSRVKPRHCPVSVTYVYEGTSYVHTLESAFSEDRLFEIIDAKLKFYQRLTF